MEDIDADTERMQADLYDDDDDDDDDEDDDDGLDEETSLFADDDEDDEEPEELPDPKGLVSPAAQQQPQQPDEEEEDMGYDEDDERLALERPRTTRPRADEEHFVNEEGSGAGGVGYKNRFKPNNSFRLSQLENMRKKLLTESSQQEAAAAAGAGAVAVPSTAIDLRESSGHFANDDEDGEDNDDGVDDEYADAGGNRDRAGFFDSQRSKGGASSQHYFRKNGNDAIKIISTPLGKVGIVYQQTPTDGDLDQQQQQQRDKQQLEQQAQQKPATQFTDFDALSPDPESSHRFPSPHPKITPVLTPDGKVALLYRGDSESSKYEPIRNLTHKFTANKNPEHKSKPTNEDSSSDDSSADDSVYTDSEDERAGDKPAPASNAAAATPKPLQPEILEPPAHAPNGGSFIIRPTSDSLLPMINRPLSEVLGIKKNQFQETRVRDQLPPMGGTEATPRSLLAQPAQSQSEQKSSSGNLHFLTKVNLAEYPTTKQQLPTGRDFDFSRDNTMLDERSRVRELEQQREREREHNEATSKGGGGTEAHTIANEQLLSKTEVINLAIIPQFDEDMERLQRLHESSGMGSRRHHRARHRHKQTEEELSGIHCVMQVMMGIAAVSTVFGMLGTFFKQRILDQLRLMHW
ncbi:hypothetical protein ACLKA6_006298 [Drosophila palustris]